MRSPAFKPMCVLGATAAVALSLFATASMAQSGTLTTPGERDFKEGNTQKPVSGTHETRKATRKAIRKELAVENKKGAIPEFGESGPPSPKPNPTGMTRTERHQDMKVRQKELAELERSRKMPVTNEAGVNMPTSR